jgi:hypothetical protein
MSTRPPRKATGTAQSIARRGSALAILAAGTGHLTWQHQDVQAQVPGPAGPLDKDLVVLASGVVELALTSTL